MTLTEEDRIHFKAVAASAGLEYRLVKRAKILLALDAGQSHAEICRTMGVSTATIWRWSTRYGTKDNAPLNDAPRSGKPRIIALETHQRIVQLACSKPTDGYSSWSQRRIASHLGISQSTVQKVLANHQLKPHKVAQWCGKSPDPEFEPKMLEIVGLYLNPPENALVLCVDEKTQIQALDRTQPELPMRPGKPRRQTATYVRHGTVSLVAALAVHDGKITAQPIERNDSAHFLAFLKHLVRKYPHKHLHLIVDNLAVHKHASIQAWLRRKRKVTIHFTPTYSSWLNQVEIWFNLLTRDVIKGGIWKSREQLVTQVTTYIKAYNRDRAKPFIWTYSGSKNDFETKKL